MVINIVSVVVNILLIVGIDKVGELTVTVNLQLRWLQLPWSYSNREVTVAVKLQ